MKIMILIIAVTAGAVGIIMWSMLDTEPLQQDPQKSETVLEDVLDSCANDSTKERIQNPLRHSNGTHVFLNRGCEWQEIGEFAHLGVTPRYAKYLDENNELNFGLQYDKNGIILDDLQRIYDWCDYSGKKPSGWHFEWNNQTHHIDSDKCEWVEIEN